MARCGAKGDGEANLRSRLEVEACRRFQNFPDVFWGLMRKQKRPGGRRALQG